MLFKRDLAIQTLPLSKRPFEVQPQLENEDVIEVLDMICPSSVGHTKNRSLDVNCYFALASEMTNR